MTKRGYTLLEYLVALENKVNKLASNVNTGGTGDNIDLTVITNEINNLKNQVEAIDNELSTLDTEVNSNIQTITNRVKTIENNKMNQLQKTEYFYIGNDVNTFNLFNPDNYTTIKVIDDFNNIILKENENYKRENIKLTFNYKSPIKIRVEYY